MLYMEVLPTDTVWVGADPHIGHKMLVRCGYRSAGFDDDFLSFWRNNVRDDDLVIILGDWCLTTWKRCVVSDLPGKKILVKGNHDHLKKIFKFGFDIVVDSILMRLWISNGSARWLYLTHKRFPKKYWKELPRHIDYNIHGHSHGKRPLFDKAGYINADIAYFDYSLVDLRQLVQEFEYAKRF